ncbi:hypothetical protein [Actinacidiphila acidipaludis]|uniref:DUF1795 domain-containing protein n=1 Tax=Actinacidiphila acidipaludis TaxID=2873382 RepID=A0ABS7Q1D8_9ACTN|nr:hypothetical protein [Streptomyces acidipaludis]MBY8876691.1 hypothetical protein [Streptomyces acidipaludis]
MNATVAPSTYSLLLPPGWVRIPLRSGTRLALDEQVFRGIEEIPADVPRDQGVAYRLHVRRKVDRMVEEARRTGGLDLYVPARVRSRVLMASSFLVSEIVRHDGEAESGPEAVAVLARLADDRRAGEPGELRLAGNAMAVRWEYVTDPDGEVDTRCRHVDYVLPVPGNGTRWLAVSHSTAGDGDPASDFTRALSDLFDAVMTTFQWA